VSELTARNVIGAEFRNQDRTKPDHFLSLAGPSAFAAWRAPGKATAALQRREQRSNARSSK
jgi:hypothetical protein